MTEQTIRNALVYLGVAIVPPIADAVYQALAAQMAGGKPIDWGQLGLVALMALLMAVVTANRAKIGHEQIDAQADYLKASAGIPKSEMVVLHQDEAVPVIAGGFTPTQVAQLTDAMHIPTVGEIADELERRRQEHDDPTPWLPPAPEGH